MKFSLSSKLMIALLVIFCSFLANLRYQQWKNQKAVDQQKRNLQEQIAALQKKNQDLSDSLSYLGSSDFKDRFAREQLNLKRNGEVVFGFTDAPTSTPAAGPAASEPSGSNPEKWIEYFFGSN